MKSKGKPTCTLARKLCMKVMAVLMVAMLVPTGKAISKTWTIEERQEALMSRVNAAQRGHQLTEKEAKGLRKDLAGVARDKRAFSDKRKGQLTTADTSKLEEELNEVSTKLTKLQLKKRIAASQ